jgi:hypothetical protein
MNNSDIHGKLVEWLGKMSGLTVIQADQSGDRPALPYIMVRFTGTADLRDHAQDVLYAEDQSSGRITATPLIDTEWRFSVHAFGPSPTDILRPIRSAAVLAQANEPLAPGLLIEEVSQIRNLPEFINNTWEQRAQMDLFLHGVTRDGILIDTIEQYRLDIGRMA